MLRIVTYGFIGIILGFMVSFGFYSDSAGDGFFIPLAIFPLLGMGVGYLLNLNSGKKTGVGGSFLSLLVLIAITVLILFVAGAIVFGVH